MSAPSPFWPASSPCCRPPRPARICFPTGVWAPAAGLKARQHPEVQTAKAIGRQGNTELTEEEEHVYSRLHCFIHFAIATALALAALAASGPAPAASPSPAPP